MAVKIDVPAGVADWVDYLNTTWLGNFLYDGHGDFSAVGSVEEDYGQWAAGNSGTSQSAALLEGDFSYQQPGGFVGDVDSLSFGSNLTGNSSTGYALGTSGPVLTLDLSEATTTTLFTYVIYNLSNNQSLTSLWSYLGEQGTEQTGNGLDNYLYSFSGSDTLTGGAGEDTFVFLGTNNGADTISDFVIGDDLIDFNAVSEITGFDDLVDNHLSAASGTGYAVIAWSGGSVTLAGHAYSTFEGNFSAYDFDFA